MSVYQSMGGTPTVVAVIVSIIVTWVISWYFFKRGKVTKALGWTPLRITQIVTRPVTDVAKLALIWNKQESLRTPYIVKIRIKNIGSREVIAPRQGSEKSDYIQPLVVEFDRSKCYEATISEAFKTVLKTPMAIEFEPTRQFEVPMPTLNMAAWVDVEMIADGEPEFPRLNCHLEGQTAAIQPVPGRYRRGTKSAALIAGGVGLFLATLGFGLLGLYSYYPNGGGFWPPTLLTIGILLVVAAVLVYGTAWFLDLEDWNKVKRVAPELFVSKRPRVKVKSPRQ
jgi:hypothetical protein